MIARDHLQCLRDVYTCYVALVSQVFEYGSGGGGSEHKHTMSVMISDARNLIRSQTKTYEPVNRARSEAKLLMARKQWKSEGVLMKSSTYDVKYSIVSRSTEGGRMSSKHSAV